MKLSSSLLITLFFMTCLPAQTSEKHYMPGRVITKLNIDPKFGIQEFTNTPQYQQLEKSYDIKTIERIFPAIPDKFKMRDALERTYEIRFNVQKDVLALCEALQQLPIIAYAEPRYGYSASDVPNDPYYQYMDQFGVVEAEAAWDIVKGEEGNVVIAIVDNGTDIDHEDLADNLWTNENEIPDNGIDDDENGFVDDVYGWDFYENDGDPTNINAGMSHGTHVAGTACGVTNNETGVASISWNVKHMNINVSDPGGSYYWGYEGIYYGVVNGSQISNNSWGGGWYSFFGQDVINFATANNVLIVAAAGNNSTWSDYTLFFPAQMVNVFSVGATNRQNDLVAWFTNYGTGVDVFAPGGNINSTLPDDDYSGNTWNGTSMAAPMTAGAIALVLTHRPELSPFQAGEQVRVTCDNIDNMNQNYQYVLGKGRVNAHRALIEEWPSVRVARESLIDSENLFPGDTMGLVVHLTNYLVDASNVTVTIYDMNPNVVQVDVDQSVHSLGNIASGDTTSFTFNMVVPDFDTNQYLVFYLGIEADGGYTDSDILRLPVEGSPYLTHSTSLMNFSITKEGNIGFLDFADNSEGDGFTYDNENVLYEGGLLWGIGPDQVSDCIRGDDPNVQENDITIYPGSMFSFENGIEHWINATYVDDPAENPTGLNVNLYSVVTEYETVLGNTVLSYGLDNLTGEPIDNIYIGLFVDYNIGAGNGDHFEFDEENRSGYIWNADSGLYAGVQLINNHIPFKITSFDVATDLGDGFSNEEKWAALSGGINADTMDATDAAFLVSAGPLFLMPYEQYDIAFSVGAGTSLTMVNDAFALANSETHTFPGFDLIRGCMDEEAVNYNEDAEEDNHSCLYSFNLTYPENNSSFTINHVNISDTLTFEWESAGERAEYEFLAFTYYPNTGDTIYFQVEDTSISFPVSFFHSFMDSLPGTQLIWSWNVLSSVTGDTVASTLGPYYLFVHNDYLKTDDEFLPTKFALHPPYPNPFNPTTTIRFSVQTLHATSVLIYDITGRVVDVLVNGEQNPGNHEIQWNASQHASGIYFVELVSEKKRDIQKLILLK